MGAQDQRQGDDSVYGGSDYAVQGGPKIIESDLHVMSTPIPPNFLASDRLRDSMDELHRHAPQWAARLSSARSERELLDVVSELFNLTHSVTLIGDARPDSTRLEERIRLFICNNLHKGLTLKLLSQFLGYSEKYCSDLFHATMGLTFSEYLKRRRIERALALLKSTDQALGEVARALGFSDQFAFSHFFKRATGHSPLAFRRQHQQTKDSDP